MLCSSPTPSPSACLRLSTHWHSVWAQMSELQPKQTCLPYSAPLQPIFFWPPENIIQISLAGAESAASCQPPPSSLESDGSCCSRHFNWIGMLEDVRVLHKSLQKMNPVVKALVPIHHVKEGWGRIEENRVSGSGGGGGRTAQASINTAAKKNPPRVVKPCET